MALVHASSGDVMNVRPFGVRLSGEKSSALFKSEDLSVHRMVLLAGQALPAHQVSGEVTIHCIEGCLEVDCAGTLKMLNVGEMLFLARNTVHAVQAVQDASALVTIVVKP